MKFINIGTVIHYLLKQTIQYELSIKPATIEYHQESVLAHH